MEQVNQEPEKKPWTSDWLEKPKQAVVDAYQSVKESVQGIKFPWQNEWQERPRGAVVTGKVVDARQSESQAFSIDDYLSRMEFVESSGRATVKNKRSTATGLHQFTERTWIEEVARQGKKYTLKDRTDPEKSRDIAAGVSQRYYELSKSAVGREPTNVEVYMLHKFGPTGGQRVLKADENTTVDKVLSKAQIRANQEVLLTNGKPKRIKEVKELFNERFSNAKTR
jgi:hypothetical protein